MAAMMTTMMVMDVKGHGDPSSRVHAIDLRRRITTEW
jgi:hypothetical protein